jgi:hypothetical protein
MQGPAFSKDGDGRRIGGDQCLQVGIVGGPDVGFARGTEGRDAGLFKFFQLGQFEKPGIPIIGTGPSPFDIVDAEGIQFFGDPDLLLGRKTDVFALGAVP